ncbi:MAG: hypothetical protein AB4057_15385 [Crocosphaera sp.]
MKIKFDEEQGYLAVICEGIWDPVVVKELLVSIREQGIKKSKKLILLDWFNVSLPEREFYRFLAGEDVANILHYDFKLAVLYPKNFINKFAENVAVNRGANVFVCSNKNEALEWLYST